MSDNDHEARDGTAGTPPAPEPRSMTPAAERALAEARARRARMDEEAAARAAEIGGRGGEDPARYGDWEINGIAVDF